MGDDWINAALYPVLKVPSAVSPNDFNYLLNPAHSAFADVVTNEAMNLEWDERLFYRSSES